MQDNKRPCFSESAGHSPALGMLCGGEFEVSNQLVCASIDNAQALSLVRNTSAVTIRRLNAGASTSRP